MVKQMAMVKEMAMVNLLQHNQLNLLAMVLGPHSPQEEETEDVAAVMVNEPEKEMVAVSWETTKEVARDSLPVGSNTHSRREQYPVGCNGQPQIPLRTDKLKDS